MINYSYSDNIIAIYFKKLIKLQCEERIVTGGHYERINNNKIIPSYLFLQNFNG